MEGQGKAVGCAPTALPLLCKRNYSKVQRRVVGLFYSRRGLPSQFQATHSQNSVQGKHKRVGSRHERMLVSGVWLCCL
jgi:hypothetical protein